MLYHLAKGETTTRQTRGPRFDGTYTAWNYRSHTTEIMLSWEKCKWWGQHYNRGNVGQWCLHIRTNSWGPNKISCRHRCCSQYFVKENISENTAEQTSNLSRDWHCCQRGFWKSTSSYRSSKNTCCFPEWTICSWLPDCRDPLGRNIRTRYVDEESRSSRPRTYDPPHEGHWPIMLDSRWGTHLVPGHRPRKDQNTLRSREDSPDFHLERWCTDWSRVCTAVARSHRVMMVRGIVPTQTDVAYVRVLNLGDDDLELHPNQCLGTCEPYVDEPTVSYTNTACAAVTATNGETQDLPEHLQKLFTDSSDQLTDEECEKLRSLLIEYSQVFSKDKKDLGSCPYIKHKINTGTALPIRKPPRRLPLGKREIEQKEIHSMLEKGIIQPSISPWSAPIVLVTKKDGSTRFCVDEDKGDELPIHSLQQAAVGPRGSGSM